LNHRYICEAHSLDERTISVSLAAHISSLIANGYRLTTTD